MAKKKKEEKKEKKEKVISVCAVKNYLPVRDLRFHPENARTISRERLDDMKRSIVAKGFYEPILVWTKDNIVLSGNHRTKAALELIEEGYSFDSPEQEDMLPVVIEDVSERVAKAMLFETNNPYAEWIEERVHLAILEANKAGDDLKQYGFTDQQIDDLLRSGLKDAEKIIKDGEILIEDDEKNFDPTEKDLDDEERDVENRVSKEKQEALILPIVLHGKLVGIFEDIAVQVDPDWRDGDSIIPAIEAFVEFVMDVGVPDIETYRKEK